MLEDFPSITSIMIIKIVVGSILIFAGFSLPFMIVSADVGSNEKFVSSFVISVSSLIGNHHEDFYDEDFDHEQDLGDTERRVITTGSGAETLSTLPTHHGDDTLNGAYGSDTIEANDGDDTVQGAELDDQIYGDKGNDVLSGGTGNDYISAGDGTDELYGAGGDDTLRGGDGADYFSCGTGFDVVLDYDKSEGDVYTMDCEVINEIE